MVGYSYCWLLFGCNYVNETNNFNIKIVKLLSISCKHFYKPFLSQLYNKKSKSNDASKRPAVPQQNFNGKNQG